MLLDGPIHRYLGAKDRLPLVCLHGFLGNGEDFTLLADQWKGHPTVIAPDFPNYASTDPAHPLDWPTALTALHGLMTREIPSSSFDLLGYSMGGRIALQYALEFPDCIRSLTLVGATPGILSKAERTERSRSDLELAKMIKETSLDSFLDGWYEQALLKTQQRIPEPYRSRMRKNRLSHQRESIAHALKHLGTGTMKGAWNRLHEIQFPCLLVSGTEDEKFTLIAEAMLKRISMARHYKIPESGHAACFEQPKDFCRQLENFLSEL